MRIISVEQVEPGTELGRTIYGANGEVLLAAGILLNENFISRLKEIGITKVYIQDVLSADITVDDVVSERTRLEALQLTKNIISNIKINPAFDSQKVKEVVSNIIDELLNKKELMINIVDIRAINDNTFGHCVNVAILSIIVGISMGFDEEKLRNLAAGALFHDIGKTLTPKAVINKLDNLTEEDEEVIAQKHTTLGFDILRKVTGINLSSAHVALQHHERFDGTGFPRQLKGKEISEFSRIVTIADVYDRMTSRGIDGNPCRPFQALELIIANQGRFFDPEIVEKMTGIIALFPVGSLVRLNTMEKCLVIKTNKEFPTRPWVRVLVDQEGKTINPPFEIDLAFNPNYFIIGALDDE